MLEQFIVFVEQHRYKNINSTLELYLYFSYFLETKKMPDNFFICMKLIVGLYTYRDR